MTRSKNRRRFNWRSFYQWHRLVGLFAALFVIMLVVTGIGLNHTHDLGFDQSTVASPAVLDWYGIKPPAVGSMYRLDGHWIVQVGDSLYFDGRLMQDDVEQLIGALAVQGLIVVAFDSEIRLLTAAGALVERVRGAQGVPSGMRAIGLLDSGSIAIRGAHGDYRTDTDFLDWQEFPRLQADWARPVESMGELAGPVAGLVALQRSQRLTVERLLVDIHSGRLFGQFGVYLVDAAALALFFLAGSGVFLWIQQRRKARHHRRRHKRRAPVRS